MIENIPFKKSVFELTITIINQHLYHILITSPSILEETPLPTQ